MNNLPSNSNTAISHISIEYTRIHQSYDQDLEKICHTFENYIHNMGFVLVISHTFSKRSHNYNFLVTLFILIQ